VSNDAPVAIVHPAGWPRPAGYANATAASGRMVFVSGQIGWNPLTEQFESTAFDDQVAQALRNIVSVLHAAGAEAKHVVRLTWYVTDKRAYVQGRSKLGAAYREAFGRHYPAMSVVFVSALLDDQAKVEIEATAVVP
jgi:enamine deaminase RidA (YjgF/YER057c/UK114 family)